MQMTKSDYIKGRLTLNSKIHTAILADTLGCSRRYVRRIKAELFKPQPTVVGIIADTLIPHEVPGYLEFIQKSFNDFGVTKVIHIGDVIEYQSLRASVADAAKAKNLNKRVARWYAAFPEVKVCMGDHDVKSTKLNNMLEFPEGWNVKEYHIIDNVYYEHGLSSRGMYGAKNTAIMYRMSYVQGHTRAYAGTYYSAGQKDMIFGLNVGSGTQVHTGKSCKNHNTLGCGIVIDGKEGHFVPFK